MVLLLTFWVKSVAHPACSPEQMKRLACSVRIQHLSPHYLLFVLPHLGWFQDASVVLALRSLALQSTLHPPLPVLSVPAPAAWSASKRIRTSLPESAELTWVLGPLELRELEASAPIIKGCPKPQQVTMLSPDSAYLDGVAYKLSVRKYVDPKDASKLTFGLLLSTDRGLMEPITGSLSPGQWHQPLRYLAEVTAGSKQLILNCISPRSTGLSDFFDQSGSTLREVVAPYLVEGRLTLKAVIKSG